MAISVDLEVLNVQNFLAWCQPWRIVRLTPPSANDVKLSYIPALLYHVFAELFWRFCFLISIAILKVGPILKVGRSSNGPHLPRNYLNVNRLCEHLPGPAVVSLFPR